MNDKNKIKIGDFGISKQLNKEYTVTNNKLGTLDYIAPEILKEGKYNKKSDIWSLGCIIYELFNLSKYFEDNLIHEVKKIDLNLYNKKWQEIINSLLQKNYNKRMNINKVNNIL